MIEIITFMAPAICMCIILVGICGYVGIHVVMREVIFIDIALAQIAALGASLGIFLGFELNDPWIFVISLSLTLVAALLLSTTRRLRKFVPQEAFIGILYATGAAAVILAGDRLPHGSEHVHDLMVGHILWVNWLEVGIYALIYTVLGFIYFLVHNRLLEISVNVKKKNDSSFNFLVWDFIFYALLGVLVTFAVRVAGVLLVFGFLIVPAVIGSLIGKTFSGRLLVGWVTGILVSLVGSYLSFIMDFPTGGMVVVTLGITLLLVSILRNIQLKVRG